MTARAQRPGAVPQGSRPFSRPFDVRRLQEGGSNRDTVRVEIEAGDSERVALAIAMRLPAIGSLRARLGLRQRAGGRVTVVGEVAAVVTQLCVVTLEPFESDIAQEVDLVFTRPTLEETGRYRRGDFEGESSAGPGPGSDDQADPPDLIVDDAIDLGSVTAEFLALALDPYPRKPGVAFDDVLDGRDDEPSAFAALERLKAKP